jgi:hypothetical protein
MVFHTKVIKHVNGDSELRAEDNIWTPGIRSDKGRKELDSEKFHTLSHLLNIIRAIELRRMKRQAP